MQLGNLSIDVRIVYCQRSYKTKSEFEQHQRTNHPDIKRKYEQFKLICCFCEKNVRNTEFLGHAKECEIFKCNKCRNFQTNIPESFLNHITTMHTNDLSDGFHSSLRKSLFDKYLAMKCIFENGRKRNLVDTCYDDGAQFMRLIANSVAELRAIAESSGLNMTKKC